MYRSAFDRGPDGIPVIARRGDGRTCFPCEADRPVDALDVAPHTTPGAQPPDGHRLAGAGLLGSHRARIGRGHGRTPGAPLAVGPARGRAPLTS
jgi:hypothetical protein